MSRNKNLSIDFKTTKVKLYKNIFNRSTSCNTFQLNNFAEEAVRENEVHKNFLKSFRDSLKDIKNKKCEEMNNYHRNHLQNSFYKIKDLYLTSVKNTSKDLNQNKIIKQNSENNLYAHEYINYPESEVVNENFVNLINQNYKKITNIKDFTLQAKNIAKTRYLLNLRKEAITSVEEDYNTAYEGYSEINGKLKNFYSQLFIDFNLKFKIYLKHLEDTKNKLKQDINRLLEITLNAEAENKRLQNLILKKKQVFNLYLEYRNFVICVKEKKSKLDFKLPDLDLKPENLALLTSSPSQNKKSFLNSVSPKKNSALNINSMKRLSLDASNKKVQKNSVVLSYDEVNFLKKYMFGPVYSSSDEFINEFKNLEKENLNLLKKYNDTKMLLTEYKFEYRNKLISEDKAYDKTEEHIQEAENKLNLLKAKNNKLIEERDEIKSKYLFPENTLSNFFNYTIMHRRAKSTSYDGNSKINISINKTSKKLSEIFNYYKENYSLEGFPLKDEKYIGNILMMLSIVEKFIFILKEKYDFHCKFNYDKVQKLLFDLDREKKNKNAIENRLKDQINRENNKLKLNKKFDKIIITNFKKVPPRFKPQTKKIKITKFFDSINNQQLIDEYINY